jgi:prepilin-type processing-associated H-X9-DG protein
MAFMNRRGQLLDRTTTILLAVVGLFVLGALLLPMFAPARGGGRRMDCKNSLKQIWVYFDQYRKAYNSYPAFGTGAESWFGQIWRPTLATDGNLFRCALVGKSGAGTHYWCILRAGEWPTPSGTFRFSSPEDLESPSAPRNLPIACDQLRPWTNHEEGGDVNVLYLDGHVDVVSFDSEFVKNPPAFLGPSGWNAPAGTK